MKIAVVHPNENWILDRIAKEWKSCYPELNTNDLYDADIVWLLSSWQWSLVPLSVLSSKYIVATVHHIVKDKFTKDSLQDFLARDRFVNEYHVPCEKTKEFISKITKKPINVIGYWYNSDFWYPSDKSLARKKLFIPEDKYVIGSFQRDTEGHDLKSPKLEKGPDLFVDYVSRISQQKDVLVLLGGWRRQYVISRLEELGISYKYVEMAPIDLLRDMYAACDLYVVASRCEGGPQALMEAAAMKVPIVSTDVGMARDVLAEECILEDISNDLYFPLDKDVDACYRKTENYKLINKVKEYYNMFSKIVEGR